MFTRLTDVINSPCHHIFMLITSKMALTTLVVALSTFLAVASVSVNPEENTNLYEPLNPNMLQCPNTTIEGKDGDTVILPCSTKNKTDISHDEVEWSIKDPATGKKFVHLYFQGEDFLHNQRDDFKDRTSLFKEELSSGNCSLSLRVTTSHSGRYYCCVGGRLHCTVNLKVLSKGTNDTSLKHQDDPESPDKPNNDTDALKVGLGVGIPFVIIVIIALVYCCREQLKNLHPQRNPSNSSNGQELEVLAQQPPQNQEKKPLDQNPNEEQIPLNVVVDQDN